jgi:hypothetical protein
MSSDLVSAVLQFLTPVVVERVGAASGLESATAQKAATLLVPSLLSGLSVLSAKPRGAQQLETTEPIAVSGKLTYFEAVPDHWISIGGTLNNYVGREIVSKSYSRPGVDPFRSRQIDHALLEQPPAETLYQRRRCPRAGLPAAGTTYKETRASLVRCSGPDPRDLRCFLLPLSASWSLLPHT